MIFENIMKLAKSLPPKLTQMEEIIRAKKQLKKKKSKDSYTDGIMK